MDKINKRSFLGRVLGAVGILNSTPVATQTLTSEPEALIKPKEVKSNYGEVKGFSGTNNYTGRYYSDVYSCTGTVIYSG